MSVLTAKPVFVVSVLMAKPISVVSVGLRMFKKKSKVNQFYCQSEKWNCIVLDV